MHKAAGTQLKESYLDKMAMYSRLGKIICILKENNAQPMNPVSRWSCPLQSLPTPSLPRQNSLPDYSLALRPN